MGSIYSKLIGLIIFLISINLRADFPKIHWFGASFIVVENSEGAVLFDPFITRPSLWKVLSFQDLPENRNVYKRWIPEKLQKKIKAVFISHGHYDHILDLYSSSLGNEAKIFLSPSIIKVAKEKKISPQRIKPVNVNSTVLINSFNISVLPGLHPPHFMGITLLDGNVEKFQSPAPAYAYKMGEVFTYLIEVDGIKIFYASSGLPIWKKEYQKIDILIQGVANKSHYKELVKKQVAPSKSKLVIPIHFDDFFKPLGDKPVELITSDVNKFEKLVKKQHKVIIPQIGKPIIVNKEL